MLSGWGCQHTDLHQAAGQTAAVQHHGDERQEKGGHPEDEEVAMDVSDNCQDADFQDLLAPHLDGDHLPCLLASSEHIQLCGLRNQAGPG